MVTRERGERLVGAHPEGVYVYVPEGRDPESLPESVRNEIRRQAKGQS